MSIGLITSPASWLNGTPASPTWFQTVQDNINGMLNGTGPTFKSLRIDGVGGSTSSIDPGTLSTSGAIYAGASVIGTSLPTPAMTPTLIYKELAPAAWGSINNAGIVYTIAAGVNVSAINRTGVGVVTITLGTGVVTGIAVVPCHSFGSSPVFVVPQPSGTTQITFRMFTSNTGAAIDAGFGFVVYGF